MDGGGLTLIAGPCGVKCSRLQLDLNAFVSVEDFGAKAHFMRTGGGIDVLAEEWKLHPEDLAEILTRCPRDGFASDADRYIQREARQHPGSRFACLNPLFPMMMKWSRFSSEG